MQVNRLTRNIFSAAAQILVQIVVLLVLYRYLLDTIGVEKLGIWSIVLATASAARVSELGMAGSVTKYVAGYRAEENHQAAAESLQTAAVSLGIVLGIVLILLYPGLLWALPYVLPAGGVDDGRAILPYGLISLWLTAVASIWMSGLDGCLRSDLRAGLMVGGSLVFLFISFVSVARYGLVGLAAAQVVQGVILVILGWVIVRRVMRLSPWFPLQWRLTRFREMLGYGVNFQINSVVMMLFEPVTKILLGRYGELSAAGYFDMAQRLVMAVRGLIVESNRVIVPVFAGMDVREGRASSLYARNMQFLLFLVTPVFVALLAFAPVISELWIGYFQWQFVVMVICLALAWYLNSVTAPAYFAYLGQGKLYWITVAHIIMGSTNIIAGYVFGHLLGWQGIIAAFSLSLVLGSFIPVWAYHREHRISIIQILSVREAVLTVIYFGFAVVALAVYWVVFDAGGSIWAHVGLVMGGIVAVTTILTWFHPVGRQIFAKAKVGLYVLRGKM